MISLLQITFLLFLKKSGKIKPIILFCKDEHEQKIWITDIRDAINSLAENRDKMQRRKEEARLARKKKATLKLPKIGSQLQLQVPGLLQSKAPSNGSFVRSETFANDGTAPQPSPMSQSTAGHQRRETASPTSPSTPSIPVTPHHEDSPKRNDLQRRSSF